MPPAAAVRMTVRHPAAIPVRSGWTTSSGRQAFVQVAPTAQDQETNPPMVDGPCMGPMPPCGVGREEGQRVERDRLLACTQHLGRPGEPAPEEHKHVVVVDAQATGEFAGAVLRPVGGGLHGLMVEVQPPAGA